MVSHLWARGWGDHQLTRTENCILYMGAEGESLPFGDHVIDLPPVFGGDARLTWYRALDW